MWQNPERLGREQPIETTAQVQAKYPNFNKKLAKKDVFVHSKVNDSHALFNKCRRGAACFKKLTTRALSREVRTWKQKKISKNRFF